MENSIKMDDLGEPLFLEISMCLWALFTLGHIDAVESSFRLQVKTTSTLMLAYFRNINL